MHDDRHQSTVAKTKQSSTKLTSCDSAHAECNQQQYCVTHLIVIVKYTIHDTWPKPKDGPFAVTTR